MHQPRQSGCTDGQRLKRKERARQANERTYAAATRNVQSHAKLLLQALDGRAAAANEAPVALAGDLEEGKGRPQRGAGAAIGSARQNKGA